MQPDLSGLACHLCKSQLQTPIATLGVALDSAATSDAPVVYYPECSHWLHLHCVRTVFSSPAASACGACITNTHGVGVYRNTMQRLHGLGQATRLANRADSSAVIGRSTAFDTGDNPAVALRALNEMDQDIVSLKRERKALVAIALKDEEQFEKDFAVMKMALDTNEQISQALADKSVPMNEAQRRVMRKFFTDGSADIWSFLEQGGAVRTLVQMGATWDELCLWGITKLRRCHAMGLHGCTLQWAGIRDIAVLCRPPICMTFVMFFNDVCQKDYDTLRDLRLTVSILCEMRFTFERNIALLLNSPVQMLRAFDHIAGDECITRLGFSNAVLVKLKQISDRKLQQMLHAKFTEWQLHTPSPAHPG